MLCLEDLTYSSVEDLKEILMAEATPPPTRLSTLNKSEIDVMALKIKDLEDRILKLEER